MAYLPLKLTDWPAQRSHRATAEYSPEQTSVHGHKVYAGKVGARRMLSSGQQALF